jgi:DNA-directed RNA polymerase subunit RPC12/RpoP
MCADAADAIEALQAQLPKRGKWIHSREIGKEWIYDHWVTYYEDWHCSNCKVVFEQEEKPKYNFCPNCGAKMEVQE